MPRAALALAVLLALTLNGSIAVASMPGASCNAHTLCAIPLNRLTTPPTPPANPAWPVAFVTPAQGQR